MHVAVFTHPACLLHEPGPAHPESPSRLRAVLDALDDEQCAATRRFEAPLASEELLARVHRLHMIQSVHDAAPKQGTAYLDPDTAMSAGSLEAALRAAGAACAAVDMVMQGDFQRAFCAVRPPGHHATSDQVMGFCLFNNVAIAAAHALAAHGLERVAIVDFDVHHGNGTADIFRADARVLYASTHQMPLYPGSGAASDHGEGNLVHAPLPPGAGSAPFRAAFNDHILPALERFAPQLMIISAGFDAHRLDPLANLNLEAEDFAWVTRQLVAVANRHGNTRVVSSLEGGYSLNALREATLAHINALAEP